MDIKHIHEDKARLVHSELLNALGTENKNDQWLLFMRTVKDRLSFLFEPGRPTREQIESSTIGILGFESWGKMIEAPAEKGGLNWSINSWKQWSKAFKIVQTYPYLADLELKPSAIMTLNSNLNGEFPSTAAEIEEKKHEIARAKQADRDDNNQLKQRVHSLEVALSSALGKIHVLNEQGQLLVKASEENSILKAKTLEQQSSIETKDFEIQHLKDTNLKSKRRLYELENMSFLQYVKNIFTSKT